MQHIRYIFHMKMENSLHLILFDKKFNPSFSCFFQLHTKFLKTDPLPNRTRDDWFNPLWTNLILFFNIIFVVFRDITYYRLFSSTDSYI